MSAARSLLHCCFTRRTTGLASRSGAVRAGGAHPYGAGAGDGPPCATGRGRPETAGNPDVPADRIPCGRTIRTRDGCAGPATEPRSTGHRAAGAPATYAPEPPESKTPGTDPRKSRNRPRKLPGPNPRDPWEFPGTPPRDSPEERPFPATPNANGSTPCATGAEPHVTGLSGPASRPPGPLRPPSYRPLTSPSPPPRPSGSGPRAVPLPVPRVTLSRRLALYRIEGRHRLFANDGRGLSCGGWRPRPSFRLQRSDLGRCTESVTTRPPRDQPAPRRWTATASPAAST